MGRDFGDLFSGLVGAAIICVGLIILAVIVTPLFLLGIAAYVGVRLWLESPVRLERLAKAETMQLYHHAMAGQVSFSDAEIEAAVAQHWPTSTPEALRVQLLDIGRTLFDAEGLSPDIPPPPELCNTVEGGRYRDLLARQGQARNDRQMLVSALDVISQALAPVTEAAPPMEGDVLVSVEQFLTPLGPTIDRIVAPFFQDTGYNHFKALRDTLDRNLRQTHRTNPVYPADYKGDDAVETYFKGTQLLDLFSLKTPFSIPDELRFEHMHVVAGSGHGKTQTLQYLIAQDLPDVAEGRKSAVVIDSQGDLIRTILATKHLPPEQIVLIDPEDIAFPVCLNLFSVGMERLDGYSPLERERLTNSIIELYDFVLGSLLSAGMTAKQSVVFRYVTRLMFHIPDATIHTLQELLEPDGTKQYAEYIAKLEGTPRRFFETEFDSKEFNTTKTQVLRRLYGVLENQTFERMFSNPQSKFDMFTELNAGKLILINTSKSLLKEQGTEIFGRFFIALITQAAQERATIPDWDRLPVHVYIDEAQDYFDANIGIILSQARKYRVGLTMAHQFLGQLSSGLPDAMEANTSIKLAGGVSAKDARALASQMSADAEMIQRQPKGTFATFLRGLTQKAVPIAFPFFVLEKLPKTTKEERAAILQHSREAYAEPWQPKADHNEPKPDEPEIIPPKNDTDDPTGASPEL
ncbi:type IV secretory system conjugative DNA transfer family protein [uncultured Roseobacter sp.]|uniref:type IV secretory system conjugative DNA transfer family protein n=1 Tax=uncultured Roseobacter sp. TaxID=114847 RepID=UPI00261C4FB0|nr:ATP-binding protein [uncultured Roseobacter sp.]